MNYDKLWEIERILISLPLNILKWLEKTFPKEEFSLHLHKLMIEQNEEKFLFQVFLVLSLNSELLLNLMKELCLTVKITSNYFFI